jgi:hypothetical protein
VDIDVRGVKNILKIFEKIELEPTSLKASPSHLKAFIATLNPS